MEFEKIKEIIANAIPTVDASEITMETSFKELGADSLDLFQVIMELEETYGIDIPNEVAEKIVTVKDAVEQIQNAVN